MSDHWFVQLVEEDPTDPHCPMFWETLGYASRQGWDLKAPDVTLPEPSIGVQVAELQRAVAIKTPTMAMEILTPVPTVD